MKDMEKGQLDDKYIDPENVDAIIKRLKCLPTMGEVKNLVDEVFPNWIVSVLPSYSSDYQTLLVNWSKICSEVKVKPAQVIIVDFLAQSDKHKLICTFAECFTRAGFSVRRNTEFIPCQKCKKAIPSEQAWNIMKNKGDKVPEIWSTKCSICI
jgi:hypothetical protein